MGDHHGVVRAQKTRRQQQRLSEPVGERLHGGPHLRVGGHASGHDDSGDALPLFPPERLFNLEAERLRNGQHIGRADVAQRRGGGIRTGIPDASAFLKQSGVVPQIGQRRRLQAAEAEIQIVHHHLLISGIVVCTGHCTFDSFSK